MAKPRNQRTVEALRHEEATRRNIPTAEYQSVIQREQDWSDHVVSAPPLYIQEKVHPKAPQARWASPAGLPRPA